jgi:hypothetical protein
MDFYTLPTLTLVAIAQQTPATWFKLVENVPYAVDIEDWHVDNVKGSYIQKIKDINKTVRHYLNITLHRDRDLPASEWSNGDKLWYKNELLHRDGDFPAIERTTGTKFWYKNGQMYRDGDLPTIEFADGDRYWYKNGLIHRDGDLPAIIWADGKKCWYNDGRKYTPPKCITNPP